MKTTKIEWHTGEPPQESGWYGVTATYGADSNVCLLDDDFYRVESGWNGEMCSMYKNYKVIAWAYPIEPYNPDKPKMAYEPSEMGECWSCKHNRIESFDGECELKTYRRRKSHYPDSFICDEPLEEI